MYVGSDVRFKSVVEQLDDRDVDQSMRYLPHVLAAGAIGLGLALTGLAVATVVDELRGGDMIQVCTTDAQGVQHCQ